jgi:hypothetical protein
VASIVPHRSPAVTDGSESRSSTWDRLFDS